jgi:hypothetical protein
MSCVDDEGYPTDPHHPWNSDRRSAEQVREDRINAHLRRYEQGYRDGNLGALHEALNLCQTSKRPLPKWCADGLRQALQLEMRGESRGKRGQAHWVTRYREAMRDLERYHAVLEGRGQGISWDQVYEAATQMLEGTDGEGCADTIEKAYKRVNARLKSNPGIYMVLPSVRLG